MHNGKKWTSEELSLVLNMYSKMTFGKMHSRNPDVIRLAEHLGRTPGSVAMKLVNFAAIDPRLARAGLSGCSHLDHQIWEEYFHNEAMIAESERIMATVMKDDYTETTITDMDFFAENREIMTNARIRQDFFREAVLSNFNDQCCITGIDRKELLVASHIIPWANDADNRLNPQNGLCLNALHDRAFDRGLITLDDALVVVVSPQLPRTKQLSLILDYEGRQITKPEKFMPGRQFLAFHRKNVFLTG